MLVEPGRDGCLGIRAGVLTSCGKCSCNLEAVIGRVSHEAARRASVL